MKKILAYILFSLIVLQLDAQTNAIYRTEVIDSFNGHKVMLDDESKIISWITQPISLPAMEFY